jgi:hypothetical protein
VGRLAALPISHYLSPLLFGEDQQPLPWILPATEVLPFFDCHHLATRPVRRALSVDPGEASEANSAPRRSRT